MADCTCYGPKYPILQPSFAHFLSTYSTPAGNPSVALARSLQNNYASPHMQDQHSACASCSCNKRRNEEEILGQYGSVVDSPLHLTTQRNPTKRRAPPRHLCECEEMTDLAAVLLDGFAYAFTMQMANGLNLCTRGLEQLDTL